MTREGGCKGKRERMDGVRKRREGNGNRSLGREEYCRLVRRVRYEEVSGKRGGKRMGRNVEDVDVSEESRVEFDEEGKGKLLLALPDRVDSNHYLPHIPAPSCADHHLLLSPSR